MIDSNSFHPLLFLFSSLLSFASSPFTSLPDKAFENKTHYFRISKKGIITQWDHHQHNPPSSSFFLLIVEWKLQGKGFPSRALISNWWTVSVTKISIELSGVMEIRCPPHSEGDKVSQLALTLSYVRLFAFAHSFNTWSSIDGAWELYDNTKFNVISIMNHF